MIRPFDKTIMLPGPLLPQPIVAADAPVEELDVRFTAKRPEDDKKDDRPNRINAVYHAGSIES